MWSSSVLHGARALRARPAARWLSTSCRCGQEVYQPYVVGKPTGKRPLDGMRASLLGLLLGAGTAYTYARIALWPQYADNAALMDHTTQQVRQRSSDLASEFSRVSQLESMLRAAIEGLANKNETAAHRGRLYNQVDELHAEILNVRQRLWNVDNDVHNTLKDYDFSPRANASIRLQQGPRLV